MGAWCLIGFAPYPKLDFVFSFANQPLMQTSSDQQTTVWLSLMSAMNKQYITLTQLSVLQTWLSLTGAMNNQYITLNQLSVLQTWLSLTGGMNKQYIRLSQLFVLQTWLSKLAVDPHYILNHLLLMASQKAEVDTPSFFHPWKLVLLNSNDSQPCLTTVAVRPMQLIHHLAAITESLLGLHLVQVKVITYGKFIIKIVLKVILKHFELVLNILSNCLKKLKHNILSK